MSVVTVQLGQCGNQIGGQFFSTVVGDISTSGVAETGSLSKKQRLEYDDISKERFFSQDDIRHTGEMGKIKARYFKMHFEVESHQWRGMCTPYPLFPSFNIITCLCLTLSSYHPRYHLILLLCV